MIAKRIQLRQTNIKKTQKGWAKIADKGYKIALCDHNPIATTPKSEKAISLAILRPMAPNNTTNRAITLDVKEPEIKKDDFKKSYAHPRFWNIETSNAIAGAHPAGVPLPMKILA